MKSLVLFVVLLTASFCLPISAQTAETVLIYSKRVDDDYSRVIQFSTGAVNTYTVFTLTAQPIEPTICGDFSPDGLFDAFVTIDAPIVLTLRYVPTNATFAQIAWRSDWNPCTIGWLDNQTLVIRQVETSAIAAIFRIQDNVLREVPVTFPPTPQTPSLPRADTSGLQYIIPSNNRTKFVYLRCAEEISPANECTGGYKWAIYDVTLNREIGVLPDLDDENVRGNRGWGDSPPGLARYYTWSPDDRYFLYAAFNEGGFSIYDTVEQRQLGVPDQSWDLDLSRLPVWSPDSRYIAYWFTGIPDVFGLDGISLLDRYGITSDEQSQLYSGLLAYDAWQERELPIEVYLQISNINRPIVWSPNTPELVTWDNEGNLYRLNIETSRFPTVIDTQVSGVMAWSLVQPIPTVDLPTLTPTPTPTFTPTGSGENTGQEIK